MSPVEPTVVRSTALYRLSVLSPLALLGVAIAVAGLTLRWWCLALIVPGLAPLPFLGRRTFRAHVTLHADGIAYEGTFRKWSLPLSGMAEVSRRFTWLPNSDRVPCITTRDGHRRRVLVLVGASPAKERTWLRDLERRMASLGVHAPMPRG